ncbi:MAG: DUF2490 domain-containing protein [Crocinitomicaceae bacterium]
MKARLITFSLGLLLGSALYSQKIIDSHNNTWLMYFGNHKLTDHLSLHTEYQFRRNNFLADWQQSLARIGIDFKTSDNSLVTGGYGWIVSFPYGKQPIAVKTTEHRVFEQFILKNTVGKLHFNHRYRLEQRFIENAFTNAVGLKEVNGTRFRQRARYRLMVTMPLNNKELIDKTLFLSAYEEIFLGFGKGIGANVLDQNRLYFALGWRFNKNINTQLGYLNHYVLKGDGQRAERNHTLQLSLTYNLDFRSKE